VSRILLPGADANVVLDYRMAAGALRLAQLRIAPEDAPGAEAPQLRLVPLAPAHAERYRELQNEREVVRLTRLPWHDSVDAARRWIERQVAIPGKWTLAVWHPALGQVGGLALQRSGAAALFYYWIAPRFQRRGYGRAAVELMKRFAEQQAIARLYSSVFEDNWRSRDLLLRAGFARLDGVQEESDRAMPCYWAAVGSAAPGTDPDLRPGLRPNVQLDLRLELQHLLRAAGSRLARRESQGVEVTR
jgi:RimJ/RimL family protein N-acetyltransferase